MKYLFALLLPLALISCKAMDADNIEQGIKGQVRWFEGNLMPSPGVAAPEGKPVKRTVLIYEVTNMDDLTGEGSVYTAVGTKKVAEVETDKEGNFAIALDAGKYSLFTKEEGGYFANSFDGANNINVVTVEEGKVTTRNIKIDYQASY